MPSNFLLPTIAVAVATLSLTLHAQDNSPISLERIVELHSQQLNRLKSASIVYDVTHVAQPGQAKSTESCRVIIDGPFEAYTTLPQDSVKPEYCWWHGTSFGRVIGFDPDDFKPSPESMVGMRGFLYHEDLPMQRLFSWRSLRSYRLFASDSDLTLRQLCEQSSDKPSISKVDGLIRVSLGHPGAESEGVLTIPRGSKILIDLDPACGYMMKRSTTTIDAEEAQSAFSQTLEVATFTESADGLFLPSHVKYTATSNGVTFEQQIVFRYANVNENLQDELIKFPPNLVVTEFNSYADVTPSGFFVVGTDGALGKRYDEELVAMVVRDHRLGIGPGAATKGFTSFTIVAIAGMVCAVVLTLVLATRRTSNKFRYFLIPAGIMAGAASLLMFDVSRKRSLDSTIDRVAFALKPGELAPSFSASNLMTGLKEEVTFPGEITVVEFWATWCGPCQPAMQNLHEDLLKHKAEWADRVRVVTISVDEDREVARRHIEKKNWKTTLTLSDGDAEHLSYALPSAIARSFGISALPTCLLIDSHGSIVYRGHPKDLNLKTEIERLLSEQ